MSLNKPVTTGKFLTTETSLGSVETLVISVKEKTLFNNAGSPKTTTFSTSILETKSLGSTAAGHSTTSSGGQVISQHSSTASPSSATTIGSTATTAGSTSTTSPTSKSGGGPVTTGELAGAVVACLLGAAILTFLATFLFFRKRNQRTQPSRDYHDDHARGDPKSSKGLVAVAEKPASSSDGAGLGWQAYLPQSADDRTIQNGIKTFFDQIELHVDNYYTKANVELDGNTREALSEIDTGNLPGPIEDLITSQRTVLSVIKHCIANLLITKMFPQAASSASLLPPNLSVQSTKLNEESTRANEYEATRQAYSQWKVLNAYLFPRAAEEPAYVQGRDATANAVSELIYAAFAPWQKAQKEAGALQMHEKSLVATAGNVGVLIMSQPSQYEFRWNAGVERGASSRSLITLPGFWKVTDEKGRPLEQPQLIVSPFIVRV